MMRHFQASTTSSVKPPRLCSQKTQRPSSAPTRKEASPDAPSSRRSARIVRLVARALMTFRRRCRSGYVAARRPGLSDSAGDEDTVHGLRTNALSWGDTQAVAGR